MQALDHVVADDRSYVLMASGGLYCSGALLREACRAAPTGDQTAEEPADFPLPLGLHAIGEDVRAAVEAHTVHPECRSLGAAVRGHQRPEFHRTVWETGMRSWAARGVLEWWL